ncbi:light-regulated signal transduction histidine kinase (bacteriophytochrome) [Rhodoblastus acidophilus]|uniref:GAF domain-containing protein n=1 Tax=Rhodoblastus acidophilus TaxID=1074 RepID=UPI00222519B8|nr:GAF domain-containing protein [Rhodoblastus acidophilus]MCW2285007.1 light-regulated signal transduction histidine kinase (bacteriophytochrome) [Rhodoblastus acidophilus]MCW2333929.1 light-regulated signal transduction histidine kinase (bacteriophytochrome) [Rhodoblastus acidophilus]
MSGDQNQSGNGFDAAIALDLTHCDREPIHIPASVQPHGALLALDPETLQIIQAGGDTAGILGHAPETLPGRDLQSCLPRDLEQRVKSLLENEGPIVRPLHAFTLETRDGRTADALVHESSGLVVLELEPIQESNPEDALSLMQSMLLRVHQATTPTAFCQSIADEVRRVSGFDRVMVYRFLPDGSGMVEAEARDGGVESFLGLHYPASDIPKQARELYLKNWIRLIPDARYKPAPILPPLNPRDGRPLDLSHSQIRSVSPIHLKYLANMGVTASMSLSIILDGRLWGLVACHHSAPRFLTHRLRMACELFAQMVSSQLETRVAAQDFEEQLRRKRVHQELLTWMSQEGDLAQGLMRCRPNLLDYIPAEGVGLWFDGVYTALGATPPAAQIAALVAWLNSNAADGVYHTDKLPLVYPPAAEFADVASGLMAISVSKFPRDYVLWFRPETIRTLTWAGNPAKPVTPGPDGDRLSPRTSFEAWRQSVRLHAQPWRNVDVESAHTLRVSLLEVILRRIDHVAREREEARAKQEALAIELDRRLAELKQETERRAVAETELSMVLRSTVEEQEAERLRIARELHDTLGQTVTLLQLGLDELGEAMPAQAKERLAALRTLAKGVGSDVNRLAWEIRPTALDDLGLQTAIQHLVETWSERLNFRVDLRLALDDRRLDPAVETTLYRVLQEAITNIARHAEATRVGVLLEARDKEVRMIIEDDGRGFSVDDPLRAGAPTKRLGLLGIRERLSLVSGALEIETAPGRGCTLFVRVPL